MAENQDGPTLLEGQRSSRKSGSGPSGNYRRYVLLGWLILLVVFGVFGVWALTAPLSGAVVAQGRMAVDSSSKTVNHPEGGVVRAIHVEEGSSVEAGETLVELDPVRARSELNVMRGRLYTALARSARLQAEQEGAEEVTFPGALQEPVEGMDLEEVRATQQAIFRTRRAALESELEQQSRQIATYEAQIAGLEQVLGSLEEQISSYRQEVEEWSGLYEEGLSNKRDLREAQRRQMQLESERASSRAEIRRFRAEIEATRNARRLRQREYNRDVSGALGEARAEVIDARARIPALEQRVELTRVEAPVSGEVVGLNVHTLGSAVSAGDPLMEVVPTTDQLIIRARVAPDDIDNVDKGQDVNLRFPALDTSLVTKITGVVHSVSAETLQNEQDGTEYYLTRIRVTEDGLRELREAGLSLQAGMPVTAMIQTGERTLFSYIAKPISDMLARSLREP
ncbi:HlyD family type I secretion periplasmic adaptor subunit [Arhodomonas sp. SL1]|uniref:HlyD family type I secretion periplasmic adaptor subunit n=1 Tax=Arhodomonas sp. SL1 TaxID=3425691 RepID=UPI003F881B88